MSAPADQAPGRAPDRAPDRADELRASFDRGFADAPAPPPRAHLDLLVIELAGERYAIAQADVTALHADLVIVPVPTRAPALLGIAAIRTALLPIYDLRVLLGHPPGPPPRWVVVARAAAPVGIAFDRFVGHVRWRDELPAAATTTHVRGVIQVDERAHAVLELAAIAAAMTKEANHAE